MQDKLLITRKIKKTLEYVDKIVINYPHKYLLLKNNLLNTFYELLEISYQANIYKDLNYMKNLLVKIKMIEYYIKISLDNKLISFKKFENIGNYMLDITKMINVWIKIEKSK